jgi:hypothetical protein
MGVSMRNKTVCLFAGALLAAALIVPALALASPAPPAKGKWKILGGGGFTISGNGKSISNIHFDVSSSEAATTGCTAGKIIVLGTHKLRVTTSAGYSNWILGHHTAKPEAIGGVAPIKVTARQAGTTTAGTVAIVFAVLNHKSENDGYLTVGSCAFDFGAKK